MGDKIQKLKLSLFTILSLSTITSIIFYIYKFSLEKGLSFTEKEIFFMNLSLYFTILMLLIGAVLGFLIYFAIKQNQKLYEDNIVLKTKLDTVQNLIEYLSGKTSVVEDKINNTNNNLSNRMDTMSNNISEKIDDAENEILMSNRENESTILNLLKKEM